MTWTTALAAGLAAPLLAVPAVLAPTDASLTVRTLFTFADPAITESSGLVDLGPLMVTTNDSGGDADVFVIDAVTGRTVGRTFYADEVTDVEALAPAGGDQVWVGDIGDNAEGRSSVRVYRVPVGRGDRTVRAPSYELVYPDGAHDAESLVQGADGRLRIITKGILGGQVYVAPAQLRADRPNRLAAGPPVDLYATDAAVFPDGRHVLVRGYGSALVATFPAFDPVAEIGLPDQEQGEGVSIGAKGKIRLSSEGEHSPVLQIGLPDDLVAALKSTVPAPSAPASPTATATAGQASSDSGTDDGSGGSDRLPLLLLGGGLLAGAVLARLVLRRRP